MKPKQGICGIFLGGTAFLDPNLPKQVHNLSYLIAADSGCNMLHAMGILPDLLLGDMDSISEAAFTASRKGGVEIQTYPAKKDFTDGEMALAEAWARGYRNLEIYAAYGDRLDHTMANILTAVPYAQKGAQITFINEKFKAYLAKGELIVQGAKGDVVSLLPIGRKVTKVTLNGFLYKLDNEDLYPYAARAVSNVLQAEKGQIKHESGILLVFHYFKKGKCLFK